MIRSSAGDAAFAVDERGLKPETYRPFLRRGWHVAQMGGEAMIAVTRTALTGAE